jgi:chromatin segregation and condensation protein Rec8/ScpA/Scc1 (kleisin family)
VRKKCPVNHQEVTNFLAILEMARLKLITMTQVGQFEPIRLRRNIDVTETAMVAERLVDDFR